MALLAPIEELNAYHEEDMFAAQVALLFEESPLLSRELFKQRPFTSHAKLIDIAQDILVGATEADKIAIISSHPLIGAPPGTAMSAASRNEQSGGGTDVATMERLAQLNEAYSAKFGFPFIVFVNGRSKQEIVPVFEDRLNNDSFDELNTAVADFVSIARSRLSKYTPNL